MTEIESEANNQIVLEWVNKTFDVKIINYLYPLHYITLSYNIYFL